MEQVKIPSKLTINNLDRVIESVATVINSYNAKDYQKMNLTLEEINYLFSNTDISSEVIAKSVLEYYMINTNEESDNLRRVITNSCFLEESDVSAILEFLDKECSEECNSINDMITSILNTRDNEYTNLNNMVYHTMSNTSVEDIKANIGSLFKFFNDIYRSDLDETITKSFAAIAKVLTVDSKISREELSQIYDCIKLFSNEMKNTAISGKINGLLDSIQGIINITYSTENLEAIKFVNENNKPVMTLNEFKLGGHFNGILNSIKNLDKLLKIRKKISGGKSKNKFGKFKNKLTSFLFGESSNIRENIYSLIGSDNKLDVCVSQYFFEEFDNESDMNNFLSSITHEFNESLNVDGLDNIRCYYTITEGVAEIHLKDCRALELTEQEVLEVQRADDPALDLYIELFDDVNSIYNKYKDFNVDTVTEYMSKVNTCDKFTNEHFEAALEALKYLPINKLIVENFATASSDIIFESVLDLDGVTHEPFTIMKKIDLSIEKSISEWKAYENVPDEIALEAFELLLAIFEDAGMDIHSGTSLETQLEALADDWDDEDDDDDDEKETKEDKKDDKKETKKPSEILGDGEDLPKDDFKRTTPLNLSGISLALKGLYTKFKDFNTKQKEVSRNLDHSIKSFIKSMKDAASNERREQIIKGSIIPSFSKCIKFGIALIGLGIATGGLVAPVIAAIGGFALDKKLTKKEKLLLLDEIDTELEVIEKELALADQNNQLNKYRALLKYKKDLQRQYQRIRYNVRVGSDGSYFAASVGGQQKD